MDASISVLLGALVGAGSGVAGQLVTALFNRGNERRRLAVDSGFREWLAMYEMASKSGRGIDMFPPVLFVHFNNELIRAIESKGGLTPAKYTALMARNNGIRDVIRADSSNRPKDKA